MVQLFLLLLLMQQPRQVDGGGLMQGSRCGCRSRLLRCWCWWRKWKLLLLATQGNRSSSRSRRLLEGDHAAQVVVEAVGIRLHHRSRRCGRRRWVHHARRTSGGAG